MSKKKFLLIGMPCWGADYPFHSLAWVGAIVQSAGWKCKIVDLNIRIFNLFSEDDKKFWSEESNAQWATDLLPGKLYKKYLVEIEKLLLTIISENSYDIIGFSVNTWTRYFSIQGARYIKNKKPSIPILFGGVDCFTNEMGTDLFSIDRKVPDIILQGEAEIALPLFLKEFEKTNSIYTSVPGFAYRKRKFLSQQIFSNGEPELPNLYDLDIIADYSQFIFDEYPQKGEFPTFLSRGCINRCTFCSESPNFKKYRVRNPEIVVDEIKSAIKLVSLHSSCPQVNFSDSLVDGNMEILDRFLNLLLQEKIEIKWGGQMYFREELDYTFLKKLYNSGFRSAFWGFESGSQEVIRMMRKNYKMSTARRIIQDSYDLGIKNVLPVIVGYPGESPEHFIETLLFIHDYREKATFLGPNCCLVRKNSALHSNWKKFNLCNNNTFDWSTVDRKNNLDIRLFRWIIARLVIRKGHVSSLSEEEKQTLMSINYNSDPIFYEIISLGWEFSSICKNEKIFADFISKFCTSDKMINDAKKWTIPNISEKYDLNGFYHSNRNTFEAKLDVVEYLLSYFDYIPQKSI